MGASDRARTETRAFLMVASVDWSSGFEEFNLGALLGPQAWDSDSGLSSLPPMDLLLSDLKLELLSWWSKLGGISWSLPLLFFEAVSAALFNGDPERVLSSDEELDNSSVSAVPLGPRSINCLGTTCTLPTWSCFSPGFFSPIFKIKIPSLFN